MAIRIERSDMVATIVMDRPEARNAVDGPAARALIEAFEEFERDDALRVAVLWGAGGTFCAGADLKARGTERGLRLAPDGHGPMGPTRMAFSKPTLAAVEGHAVAGVDAQEALAFGLANRVVPAGRAREEAEALARAIAAFPPNCVRSDRRSAWESAGQPLPAAMANEFALGKATHETGESQAGARRFAAGAGRHGQF